MPKVVIDRSLAASDPEDPQRPRQTAGWRAGKPVEDPRKTKSWGRVTAQPSEYLVHMRGGRVLPRTSGQGASCFKWPSDSVAIVPTTIQRLRFSADQITSEKVGVAVTGIAVYRIAEPIMAGQMLNFCFPERASEKLEELLREMFVGAARRLVANLTVDECLTRRKEGIATELMREIAPVLGGQGRAGDETHQGWGVVLDTIEIQDVRVLSASVFANMQAPFRAELERRAREAELASERAVGQGAAGAKREVSLAEIGATSDVAERRRLAEEAAELARLTADARAADARLAVLAARRRVVEAELAVAEVEDRRARAILALDLERARGQREVDNDVSAQAIQLVVAQQLPALSAALQGNLGEVHVTAIDGANPFGFVAAAMEALLGLARAAGVELPHRGGRSASGGVE